MDKRRQQTVFVLTEQKMSAICMKVYLRLVAIVSLILISIGVTEAQQALPLSQTLMQHATKLADASKWVAPSYLWRGPHTLLTFRGDYRNASVNSFIQVDTRTGSNQALKLLNQQWKTYLATHRDRYPRRILDASLSPDGKWVYLYTRFTEVHAPQMTIMSSGDPDGGVLFSVEAPPNQTVGEAVTGRIISWERVPLWMADSRSCIVVFDRTPSELRLSTGKVLPIPGAQSIPPSALGEYKPGRSYEEVGITAGGHALVACFDASLDALQPTVALVSLSLKESPTPPQVTPISLPNNRTLQLIALSPDKKHLLWVLSRYTHKRAQPVEEAIFRYESWISHADGTEMMQLGWVETQRSSAELLKMEKRPNRFHPDAVEWMPDSEHISFIYKDVLYSIPDMKHLSTFIRLLFQQHHT